MLAFIRELYHLKSFGGVKPSGFNDLIKRGEQTFDQVRRRLPVDICLVKKFLWCDFKEALFQVLINGPLWIFKSRSETRGIFNIRLRESPAFGHLVLVVLLDL